LPVLFCFSQDIGLVIDASLPPEVYEAVAAEHGTELRYVIDTHIHADHLSRSRLLAERTGAALVLPVQNRAQFEFTPIAAGDSLSLGRARLTAIATPAILSKARHSS